MPTLKTQSRFPSLVFSIAIEPKSSAGVLDTYSRALEKEFGIGLVYADVLRER